MIISNNINPIMPDKIKAFAKRLSTSPAPDFNPIVSADSMDIQAYGNVYSLIFSGLQKTVNLSLVYPWVPKGFRCSDIAFGDSILTISIQNTLVN